MGDVEKGVRFVRSDTADAAFLNLDFANKAAYAYICVERGKIERFEE